MNQDQNPTLFDFDAAARVYDSWYETREGGFYDTLEKRALRRLVGPADVGDRLLEVGAGTGWWSRFFSDMGFAVTGIDISPPMIETARSKQIPRAVFRRADAHELPFEDGEFSCAAAITSLEFVRRPLEVIQEMIRCTKRSGILILGVLNREAPINRRRSESAEGPFGAARFFSAREIRELLAPFGRLRLKMCAFPPSFRVPPVFAGPVDDVTAIFDKRHGAFIVVKVEL